MCSVACGCVRWRAVAKANKTHAAPNFPRRGPGACSGARSARRSSRSPWSVSDADARIARNAALLPLEMRHVEQPI